MDYDEYQDIEEQGQANLEYPKDLEDEPGVPPMSDEKIKILNGEY